MWRWTVCLCLLIFYGYTSSQPVTDDSENVRQTRQLDFGECCPCPGVGQGFGTQESSVPFDDGMFARARDIDDCPCRPRSSDSEGASSIFLPTSMRSDENFVRPVDRKEDLKPLLHPEVDLASSVLQTLREATDEEYQAALARDAARSVAKAAEGAIFRDAVPEASNGNIVTIIVNPKHTDGLDDVIPQESHVQESRCIHAPLENISANDGQMQAAQKPPSLLREIFGLPRISKPAGRLHNNLLDMDSGASNIQEQVVHDDDQLNNKSTKGLRKFAPLMKIDTNKKDQSTNIKSMHNGSSIKKVPDFKLPSLKNKLKDLIADRSALEGKNKVNSLPLIPKMGSNNPLPMAKGNKIEDLSLSPSNIHEQAKKSFFQTKSHLENIFQKSRPVSLKNLLKLKDVEFVPLKDLIPQATEKPTLNRPTLVWPDIFKKGDNVISSNKDIDHLNMAKTTEILEKVSNSFRGTSLDADVSPSNVIKQINDDNCKDITSKITQRDGESLEPKITSNEIEDTASSPTEIQQTVSDVSNDFVNSQSNESLENTDDCNIKILPDTETNFPKSIESSFENESPGANEDELIVETSKETTPNDSKAEDGIESDIVSNDEDCIDNVSDADSITGSSNNINKVIEPNETVLENGDKSLVNTNTITEEPCGQELPTSEPSTTLDSNKQTKLIKPLDKTLSSIKENILRHIENLKNPKTSSNKLNIFDKESSTISDENLNSDCQKEEPIQVTTVKPDTCNDELGVENESSDKVSMQDLQKMSDEMLQEEQARQTKTSNNIEPIHEIIDSEIPIVANSAENGNIDSEQSANTQSEVIMDPQNVINIGDKKDNEIKNTCQNDLLPKQTFEQESDANVEASEVVINKTPQSNDIIGSPILLNKALQSNEGFSLFNSQIPDIQDITLAPITILDDIKNSFTNLFDKSARDVEEHSASEAAFMSETSNVLPSIMPTDASTNHFQLKLPPLRLEDVDLDILQLKPQSNLFSKIPKFDLHSFKTKLPIPTDLRIKPIKLQSAFENKGSLLGATLSLGQKNPLETIPSLNNFGSRIKGAKSLHNSNTLRNNLKSSQRIGDLSDTKNTLKSMQQSFESKIRGATIKPVNLQNNDLLETISRNHEDVNDKLRALHIDFNDRLETMRNNLFDKSIFGSAESRSTKSFSTFSNKNKDKKKSLKTTQPSLSSRRESKKTFKPQRFEQQKENRIGSLHGLQNKFKMPAAASVPVPKTIEVPELKATLTKSPGLTIQRASGVKPFLQNKDAPQAKESTVSLWKQASNKLPITNTRLGKTTNSFKDNQIKVTFSTTPRPTLSGKLQSKKLSTPSSYFLSTDLEKNTGRFGQWMEQNGLPSEMEHLITLPPISSNQKLKMIGIDSENQPAGTSSDRSTQKLDGKENLDRLKMSKDSLGRVQSWPKLSESAFLSKVKEAVKARLPHVRSSVTFKDSDVQSVSRSSGGSGVLNPNTDMARSASENIDVIEGQALKENVSYKCTMVCTKE